jgi:hypothetical protein
MVKMHNIYILSGILLIVLLILVGENSDSGNKSGNKSGGIRGPDKMSAYFASREFVKNRLKAPSTAKFPWYREAVVTDLGGRRFRVSAYVDAQNNFGAQIRTRYICVLKGTDELNWTLESISM